MSLQFKIGNRQVGAGHPAFFVAELSGNHLQSFDTAVQLVHAAKDAGADAVKLQTYTPDTITLDCDKEWFRVGGEDNPDNWKGKTLHQLYQTAYTPWEWQPKLKELADGLGLILFSSPFDETAVDFLEAMRVPCYKIASYEATDFTLLRKVARTEKPVIMSVGYASLLEVEEAIGTLRRYGAEDIAILHCVTGYAEHPTVSAMNLATIPDIAKRFNVAVGFSDNNGGIDIPVAAVAAGASIIEKHLILKRDMGGPDARFSVEPQEFTQMVRAVRGAEKSGEAPLIEARAMGEPTYGPVTDIERYNLRWRRSLFAVKAIKKGEMFTSENVRSIRPASGLETKHIDAVLGKRAADDIEYGTPLSWNLIH